MKLSMSQISTSFARVRAPLVAALRRGERGQEAAAAQTSTVRQMASDVRMQEVKNRLAAWVGDGVRVQGNMNILTGRELENIVAKPDRGMPSPARTAYWTLVSAVDSAQVSLRALDVLPLQELAGKPLSESARDILTSAVQAQHGIFEAAKDLQAVSGPEPGLVRLMADSQARASELLNLAARMVPAKNEAGWRMMLPHGAAAPEAGASVLQAAQSLSTTMHGVEVLLDSLTTTAGPLFAQVDILAGKTGKMSAAAFTEQLVSVKRDILQVQADVEKIIHPEAGAGPVLQGVDSAFQALNAQLQAALARLEALESPPDFKAVARNYAAALVEQPSLAALGEDLPLPRSIQISLGLLDNGSQEIKEMLLPYAGENFNPRQVTAEFAELQEESREIFQMSRTFVLLALADADEGTVGQAEDYALILRRRLPFLSKEAASVLGKSMESTVRALVDDPYAGDRMENLKGALNHSLFNLKPSQLRVEISELKRLSTRTREAEAHRGAYIAKAFENNFSMATLAEASARGIDPASVEFIAHDGALIPPPKELGSGACNTVLLCTYKDAGGKEVQRVFKGEVAARRGLEKLNLGKLGYDPLMRVAQLNVATKRVADAIACGDVVSQATVGVHDGKFGLFMERAPGKTATEFDDVADDGLAAPVATTRDGVELEPVRLYRLLREEGLMPTAQANLQRELCKLEWADMLCGQGDRHQSNYLVDINPETAEVRVTGIDNDASFGRLMVGAAKVDVTSSAYSRLHDLASMVEINGMEHRVVDMATLNDGEKLRVRNVFGFNQMSTPSLIDAATFTSLMGIDETTYVENLSNTLDPDALRAALLRLRDAKKLAGELQQAGRVIADWRQDSVPLNPDNPASERLSITDFQNRQREEALAGGNSASLGFYARDFAAILQ